VRGVACNAMNWHDYFTYDAETGDLIWKERPLKHFVDQRSCSIWNTRWSGKVAGNKRKDGYVFVTCDGKRELKHRIVWEMHKGAIPEGVEVDHRNRVRANSRIENLRLATSVQNKRNNTLRTDNQSGTTGVIWDNRKSKWRAYIGIGGNNKHVGYFDDEESAVMARVSAQKEHFGKFVRNSIR